MTIKDLFSSDKINAFSSFNSASTDVESPELVETVFEKNQIIIPFLDFTDPSKYIKFGSAELYYEKAIERIYNDYPYDGSLKEKKLFHISSSYVDRYIYDYKYPKTTGYAILTAEGYGTSVITDGYGLPVSSEDYEYIYAAGGLHTASAGMKTGELYKNFDKSIKYDVNKNRTQNFRVNPSDGTTIEFWLNKSVFIPSSTEKEVILDLWNGEISSSSDYGRLTIYLTASADGTNPIRATYISGTAGFSDQTLAAATFTTSSITDSAWHHYAISFLSQSSGINTFFYVDGDLNNEQTIGSSGINEFSGRLNAYLGSLQTSPSGSAAAKYAGKLSGSLDEFRFWKKRRTSKQINLNWYRPVNGGSNTEDNNTSLGCYYKFNEGIVGTTNIDSAVMDYSGRLTNGTWTGYTISSRNAGSCFESANVLITETPDPIIRSSNPRVTSLQTEMQTSGSSYDLDNTTFLYKRVPSHFRERDELTNNNIKYLYQIISSYFDTIYAQTKILPSLTNKNYISASSKPLPFADRLLENRGFKTAQLFENSSILEYITNNDKNNIEFQQSLDDIKNLIYHNIYNNLDLIYKSKGTETSIRNLIRSFGIDDEILKLNVYTDGGTHYFNDNFKETSVEKKFINFNDPKYFSSSIFQTSSIGNSNTFISGSGASKKEKYNALTLEVGVRVPHKLSQIDEGFFNTQFLSSSIFGFHETGSSGYSWPVSEVANAQVYLVRDEKESNRAKFLLTNRDGSILLSSSYYNEIYDNNQWILGLRVKPFGYGVIGSALTSSNPDYEISLYGVSHNFGEVRNRFEVSSTLSFASGSSFLSNPKRLYIGAHRTNYTGSILERSDIKISACRFWLDYLSNNDLNAHSKDITNKGVDNAVRNSTLFGTDLENKNIPRVSLLALDWDFDLVSSSAPAGTFNVIDSSSGSANTIYGWIDNIIRREHDGLGYDFGTSQTSFISKELIYTSKKELPEISYTSDSIKIKEDVDKFFIKDEDVSDNYFSIEKSMYQIISEEMLTVLSSVVEFNTLIGNPVDRYRKQYKALDHLRHFFFENVKSDMDFDRFTEYYRFIDDSMSYMISQLFPASARHSEKISDMVESHIFERNKYQNKFPLTTRLSSTEGSARGTAELQYSWKFGHAPVDGAENENCLWNKERKERTDISDRETIRQSINNRNNVVAPTLYKKDGTSYQGSTFAINRLSKPYKESISLKSSIHAGINYNEGKDRDFVYNATHIHGPVSTEDAKGIPQNVMVVGVGTGQGTNPFVDCKDEESPNEKRKWNFSAVVGRFAQTTGSSGSISSRAGMDYQYKVKSSLYWPSNVVSGTVTSGYNKQVVEKFKSGSIVTNLHSDTFSPTNDIGMQGPFTEAWVGGHQSRHVDLNKYDSTKSTTNKIDDQYTREEAWRLLLRECKESDPNYGAGDGAMGFVGPDYGGPYPDFSRQYAIRYRDERTKRPLNVRNIRTTTGSAVLGNFTENYEVVHTFGRKENDIGWRRTEGNVLGPSFNDLPQTTQEVSLVGTAVGSGGNVVMNFNNTNRIPSDIRDQQKFDPTSRGKTVIATRFSAPGGFETMSEIFLDNPSKEYSVYNAMPFRNLSVRGSGSGEAGTIRVNSHANRREGLRTLLARHSGRFGIDSQWGTVPTDNYNAEASFQKINRNTRVVVTGSLIITEKHDNFNVSRAIPSQDYGYSWVTASLGSELSIRSGNQLSFGYWPKSGILSASANVSWRRNGFDSAVNFPTGSSILGSL
jgi:hypothetical protein